MKARNKTYTSILNMAWAAPIASFLIASNALAAPVQLGTTGEYFEYISSSGITWEAASNAANSMSYGGMTGHLAVIKNDTENQFAADLMVAGGGSDAWLGATSTFDPTTNVQHWMWVDGNSFDCNIPGGPCSGTYTNFNGGEPNNWGTGENALEMYYSGAWNDLNSPDNTGAISGYIVEYTRSGSAVGDPHFTTFDGHHFDYQGTGQFLLADTTAPGDSFQIQINTRHWAYNSATIISAAAATVGKDRITFDLDRIRAGTSFAWVDGGPSLLGHNGQTLALDGGRLVRMSANKYALLWDSGEAMYVTDKGTYLDIQTTPPPQSPADTLQGLLGGSFSTALLSSASLSLGYGPSYYDRLAESWRIAEGDSLFNEIWNAAASIPEPNSAGLLCVGLLGLIAVRLSFGGTSTRQAM